MELTIITINYNNYSGLKETLKSVNEQTNKNFEYIVIDGASTDGSVDLLNEYKEVITKCISEKDNGIYNAMNKGIQLATKDYILFLNSGDTLYDQNTIKDIMNIEFKADIVEGDTYCIKNKKLSHIWTAPDEITANTFYSGSICHQSSFIKRTLFTNCLYNESYKIVSDWEFFFKQLIFKNATYQKIPRIVSKFDITGISNTPRLMQLHKHELVQAKKELMPYIWRKDYEEFIGNRTELEIWSYKNRKSAIVILISELLTIYNHIQRKISQLWI